MKVLKILGVIAVLLAVAVTGAVYAFGPSYGAMFTGKPIFLGNDSPKRYARSVLDVSETMGIYAESPEFQQARAVAEEAAKDAADKESLYAVLEQAVQAAGGKHSRLHPPASEDSGDGPAVEPAHPLVATEGGIITATVPGVGRNEDIQGYADTLATGINDGADSGACGVIVDLRDNGGGDMGPMVSGLSSLLPDGAVLSFESRFGTTDVTVAGNAVDGGGTAVETFGGKHDLPVALLINEVTASSGEATLLSFRGLEETRTFGVPTAGYASANTVYDYPDGSELMLTIAKNKARTGEVFNEDPIAPDVETDDPEAAAREWLTESGCG